jgi:hypothetical protein
MKYLKRSMYLIPVLVLLGLPLIQAQQKGRGGSQMMYNAATETTIKGTVESLDQGAQGMMMKMGMGMGTHLTLKTAKGDFQVMLGPSYFVADKGFSFAKGDEVEVTGSRVTMAGGESVIAREITKGGKTLVLRDKTGKPEWSGVMGKPGFKGGKKQ